MTSSFPKSYSPILSLVIVYKIVTLIQQLNHQIVLVMTYICFFNKLGLHLIIIKLKKANLDR